ncbi:MAG: hypothetical protein DI624_04190 [Brevundimonas sp.]|uniref:hypothetical protein n=1 Tax=Brevundimonas sp. TaxID=1871086 RepID=UPI000DAFB6CE|nr:hypothetical protein [Brevundimonas sp.]PZT99879.1 MAG: hypothetical protein DI624_04190 [Brevundimonas sp.]
MTATQAPTPGPLDSESVKLLVKGDLLRIDTGGALYEFVRRKAPPSALIVAKPALDGSERYYDRCRFSFVERPSLAPTAPVEASGSERESEAWKWLGQLYPNDAPSDLAYDANEMVDAFLAGSGRSDRMAKALERIAGEQQYRSGYCQTDITVEPALSADEAQTVAREALAHNPALRPQPSGETRAALDRLKMAAHVYEDDEMAADCATLEALLSARPLALGGQQGEERLSAALIAMVEHFERVDAGPEDKAAIQAACEVWASAKRDKALSTTPARAEALDEGAAGETILTALVEAMPKEHDVTGPQFERIAKAIFKALRAHPSPPPADDEDRVREAATLLTELLDGPSHGGFHGINGALRGKLATIRQTLQRAALKSEGRS